MSVSRRHLGKGELTNAEREMKKRLPDSTGQKNIHSPKKPTGEKMFFWFIKERMRIQRVKSQGKPWPWTDDQILQRYHFANIDRRLDRGTQAYLEIVGRGKLSLVDLVFNTVMYRAFNRESTGRALLPLGVGAFSQSEFLAKLRELAAKGGVFSSAHQLPWRFSGIDTGDRLRNYAILASRHRKRAMAEAHDICVSVTLVEAIMKLMQWDGLGGLLASQVALDLSYDARVLFDDRGPMHMDRGGSRWGLTDIYGYEPLEAHRERMKSLSERLRFTPSMTENALCEFSKYTRLKDGRSPARRLYRHP